MNASTFGLIDAINSTDKRTGLPYAAECQIVALGISWTASVGFEATCYDGEWTLDSFVVDICPKGREDKGQWVEVDFTELPRDAQGDIERACMKELEGHGPDPDAAYDAWKERELDAHLENLADRGRDR